MHSKWKIWDFFKSRGSLVGKASKGIIAVSCFDPIAFNMIKEAQDRSVFANASLPTKVGKEITTTWIDDNFKSLGLFGNTESFLVHFAEEMSADVKAEILESQDFLLDNRYLILNFNKEDAFYKKLIKLDHVETVQVQAPAFWESTNLLDYLCQHIQVFLSYDAKQLVIDSLPFDISNYFNFLTQLKINFPEKKQLEVSDVSTLIVHKKIDNFELASLFGDKNINSFYKKIMLLEIEHKEWRNIFGFMQTHMLKVLDPSYTESKSKLTKYDRQILSQNKIWKEGEINRCLVYFSKLEVKAKSKDTFLKHSLQRDFLRTLSF